MKESRVAYFRMSVVIKHNPHIALKTFAERKEHYVGEGKVKDKSQNQMSESNDLVNRLHQEYRILHLVYHRNKNQHRVSKWWREFSILKRNVTQVLELLHKVPKNKDVIRLHSLINRLLKKQLSKIYYSFNGVIKLGQFVTLGVVLVGLLARIYCIYMETMDRYKQKFVILGCIKENTTKQDDVTESELQNIAGEELGEEVSTEIIGRVTSNTKPSVNLLKTKKNKKDKKKRKNKSAIDSIFG